MKVNDRKVSTSDDPTDPRRSPIPGSTSVKYATEDSSIVCHQATEAVDATEDNKKPSMRIKQRMGTWNVRGLLKPGKLAIVEKEMNEHNLMLLGLCETHMKQQGHLTTSSGNLMFFSGHETDSKNGVGILVSRRLRKFVTGYNPINDRIMTMRINCTPLPLNIIQIYSPTAQSTKEDIDNFYGTLQTTVENISKREILIIQGDWNAKEKLKAKDLEVEVPNGGQTRYRRNWRYLSALHYTKQRNVTDGDNWLTK
ncbi:hypothetical protein B5X24_HaOG209812 [Helicoverpa armigera]|nr:hypothetical protein B5X24_HaOG209812 [Helicoverpa armigera]